MNIYQKNLKILNAIFILGLIGVTRTVLEVYMGGKWARAWFSLKPDVLFTMFFFPIFLCFYSTAILHFISNRMGLKIEIKKIISLIFFLQFLHLIIPFFDGLAYLYNIPFHFRVSGFLYIKLIFSPIAFTPLILLFTGPTSLGINIVWFFVSFVLIKTYIKKFGFPVLKSLLALSFTFYLVYIFIYPVYLFFLNEVLIGSNWMYGLSFMLLSIASIIYVKTLLEKEKKWTEKDLTQKGKIIV